MRHGRKIIKRISVPILKRSVVMPSAPTSGNRLLAREAPLWMETIAMINRQIGSSVEDAFAVADEDIL
jgi:hypothetical protein